MEVKGNDIKTVTISLVGPGFVWFFFPLGFREN